MKRWHAFTQLLLARIREFYREPMTLFWVYGFPLLLAMGLGMAFLQREPEPSRVDVQDVPDRTEAGALHEYLSTHGLLAELHSPEECQQRLRAGKTDLYVIPEPNAYRYVYDPAHPESRIARYQTDALVQAWKQVPNSWPTTDVLASEPGTRYIDFLIPGLIGMNLMGGGLWGVGFVIVDMRVRKLLKRLLATPMHRGDFLVSILTARMLFMLPEMVLLVVVGYLGFAVPLRCDLLTLTLVILTGAVAFSGIGLLIACRTDKIETVSGLMNLVMLPMWLLSGIFFSSKRFPDAAQPFIQALPLTQLNDALREIMLEGASLAEVGWRLGILIVWGTLTFLVALRFFRWQ